MGLEYQPQNNIQLISTTTTQTKLLCATACNQMLSCRTFDYDTVSKLCRLAYIWPTNQTIPPNGISYTNCSLEWLYYPAGITVDSVGNVYFSSTFCNWVTKWAPKAASGTLVAGSPIGVQGSDNPSLWGPHALALDEPNSFIYVADMGNNRIQRFVLGGSGIGVTVAGGNGQGSANNQLNQPIGIFLSRLDGSLYIADTYNNRIQK